MFYSIVSPGSVGRRVVSRVRTLWPDGRWQHLSRSWGMGGVATDSGSLCAHISRSPIELASWCRLCSSHNSCSGKRLLILPNLPAVGPDPVMDPKLDWSCYMFEE